MAAKLKPFVKRLLKNSSCLFVSDRGDIANDDIVIWRDDQTGEREWALSRDVRAILDADSVVCDGGAVVATIGLRVLRLACTSNPGPSIARAEVKDGAIVPETAENRMIMKALHVACETDDTLPVLGGVRFEATGERVDALSTDRYRLVMGELDSVPSGAATTLVPGKLVKELATPKGWVLTFDDKTAQVVFPHLNVTVVARRVPGEYPTVRKLFDVDWPSKASVKVDAKALVQVIKDMCIERNHPVALSSRGEVASDHVAAMPIPGVHVETEGEPAAWIGANPKYLSDFLTVAGVDDPVIEWNEAVKPFFVRGHDQLNLLLMGTRLTLENGEFPAGREAQ